VHGIFHSGGDFDQLGVSTGLLIITPCYLNPMPSRDSSVSMTVGVCVAIHVGPPSARSRRTNICAASLGIEGKTRAIENWNPKPCIAHKNKVVAARRSSLGEICALCAAASNALRISSSYFRWATVKRRCSSGYSRRIWSDITTLANPG